MNKKKEPWMLNQLKRSLSLISGLILCINSVWLLSQGQRHFAIALSIFIGVALILYALFFHLFSAGNRIPDSEPCSGTVSGADFYSG